MTLVIVGRTEFQTALSPDEIHARLLLDGSCSGTAHSPLFHAFGARLFHNIAPLDDVPIWVWPEDVGAVREVV